MYTVEDQTIIRGAAKGDTIISLVGEAKFNLIDRSYFFKNIVCLELRNRYDFLIFYKFFTPEHIKTDYTPMFFNMEFKNVPKQELVPLYPNERHYYECCLEVGEEEEEETEESATTRYRSVLLMPSPRHLRPIYNIYFEPYFLIYGPNRNRLRSDMMRAEAKICAVDYNFPFYLDCKMNRLSHDLAMKRNFVLI
jgi:hypothetical protein